MLYIFLSFMKIFQKVPVLLSRHDFENENFKGTCYIGFPWLKFGFTLLTMLACGAKIINLFIHVCVEAK